MKLKTKTALITGASSGIGRSTAVLLAKEGVNIVINYISNDKEALKLKNELFLLGVKAITVKADISNEKAVSNMFKETKKDFPEGIDILINNAGIFDLNDSPTSLDTFKSIFNINFLGQIIVTNEFLKQTKKGKIIYISSIHGKIGHGRADAIAYSSLKAALDSYMKNLAKYLAPNILVNSIAPGKTKTAMWGNLDKNTELKLAEDHLTKRFITPEEIAEGVVFILKNDSICGEILTIDGGMSIKTLG